MRIAQVDTFQVLYPTHGEFRFFERPASLPPGRPTVVVRITADDGTIGWGQTVPSPRWSYETPESIESTISLYLSAALIGCELNGLESIAALTKRMNREIAPSFSTGQPIAKSGIDLALHDLVGKARGASMASMWGRKPAAYVPLSWTLTATNFEVVADELIAASGRGYRSVNIKIGSNLEYDRRRCTQLRRLAPDMHLWADANGGYDEESALTMAQQLADLGFVAFEQPLPANRLSGYRRLKQQAALPILMDEGIVSCVDLEEFTRMGLIDGVTIKVARCGGLLESRRMLEFVQQEGLLWLGSGLTDPDISLAASLILFAAYGLDQPAALNGPQFLSTTILDPPLAAAGGAMAAPTGPGLGVTVDRGFAK